MPSPHAEPSQTSHFAGARIGRGTAWWLTYGFCALLALPAVVEWRQPSGSSLPGVFRTERTNYGLQAALTRLESHLVEESRFTNMVRRPYQELLTAVLDEGSRQVLIGTRGFWFHREDLTSVSVPAELRGTLASPADRGRDIVDEAARAIAQRVLGRRHTPFVDDAAGASASAVDVLERFHQQLKSAGVHLTVVIVPSKATIYPDRLWSHYPVSAGPPVNRNFDTFVTALRARAMDIVDLSPAFWRARADGSPLFLAHDRHWSPAGVELAAATVAAHIRPLLGSDVRPLSYSVRLVDAFEPTDLTTLLGFRPGDKMTAGSPTTLRVVSSNPPAGARSGTAPVLLFGDSMTGYYDAENAGFRSLLGQHLGTDVRSIIGYGVTLRAAIVGAFRAEPALLQGIKIVVLEFHVPQLSTLTFASLLPIGSPAAR